MIRLLVALGALLDLALVRLLPETGGGLYLRLVAATIVVLLPGGLIADALGRRAASLTFVWSLAAVAAALAVTFAVGGSINLTLLLLAAIAAGAIWPALRQVPVPRVGGTVFVGIAGALFGIALWQAAKVPGGDALFHLGRVRKLDALDSLSLEAVGEFADGGLHPGYAFPLWHGFLAVVGRLAGVDAADVVTHQASVLAPIAFLVVYEAGVVAFRSRPAGVAVLLGQLALLALAPGNGGRFNALALPGSAARLLLVPATITILFLFIREPSKALLASLGAAGLVTALVHPSNAVFALVPLAGFLVAAVLLRRADIRPLAAALAALAVTTGAVLAWLLPVVRDTASHDPEQTELARALRRYAGQLDIFSDTSYRLAPEVFGRSGAVAVAGLLAVPLAALAWRARWSAFVLGGSLAVLALLLVPTLFTSLADAVSLSQARRAAGFLPLAFAFAGGAAVLARLLGIFFLPVALASGVVLQLAYPGRFETLEGGAPPLVTWIAAFGGVAGLCFVAVARRPESLERRGVLMALGAALFVVPIAVDGIREWSPDNGADGRALSPGLVKALRERVPERAVVFSDLETSYRIAGYAPVYVAAGPPAHVADTEDNRPYERRRDVVEFFRTGDLAIPRRYGAGWMVVDRRRFDLEPPGEPAYSDSRYVLIPLR